MIEVEGIVISEISYGETSKIINLLTKEYGIIGVMAKGAKSYKSPLRAGTLKLTHGKFRIKYNKKGGLSPLNNVDIIANFNNFLNDIVKISYVSYIIDLTKQVANSCDEYDVVFKYLISTLKKINDGYNPQVLTNILELKYLDFLGVTPSLDGCVNCGDTKNIVTFSSYKGGYLCNNCVGNEPIINEKTLKLIRILYNVDIDKIDNINLSSNISTEINNLIEDYYNRYTGLYFKSKFFLKNILEMK